MLSLRKPSADVRITEGRSSNEIKEHIPISRTNVLIYKQINYYIYNTISSYIQKYITFDYFQIISKKKCYINMI